MDTIGLWHISESGPARLPSTELGVERELEDWIERDPALLERGLVIVGRQIRLEGGPLDLLALDPQGRWVLIEIKRERLRREVIAQAIDYASCLHAVDPAWLRDQCDAYLRTKGAAHTLTALLVQRGRTLDAEDDGREVVIYLVGTGLDAGLERMVGYLAERAELAVRMVTFAAFREAGGGMLLAREIHERDEDATPQMRRSVAASPTAEAVLAMGDQNGVGAVMRTLHAAAVDVGLHVRPWGKSIMFAPPAAKSRCLFTVWAEPRAGEPGIAKVWIAADMFAQFYGVSEPALAATLGIGASGGWVWLDKQRAERVAAGVRELLGTWGQE
jgi:hypothetical protein